MQLPQNIKNEIKEYALIEYPKEACGLIIQSGDGNILAYRCKNIASNPSDYFELSCLDYVRAVDGGKNKVIGLFHSQKNKNLSILDTINAINHKIYSIVYSTKYDEFFETTDKHYKYRNYCGKEFKIGKQDCFTLLKDFYKNEYNININDYHRDENWYKNNPNLIKDNYKKEGGVEIEFQNIKEGDVIVFSFGHFAIYLNDDLILHHKRGHYSNIEKITDSYKKRITLILRHKDNI